MSTPASLEQAYPRPLSGAPVTEWPELRGNLEAWLDDANFDVQGQARHSLYTMMSDRKPGERGNSNGK